MAGLIDLGHQTSGLDYQKIALRRNDFRGRVAALFETIDLLIVPVQDVFGWRDRINQPATVTGRNWTFRLPWAVDTLHDRPEARERQQALRRWSEPYHR